MLATRQFWEHRLSYNNFLLFYQSTLNKDYYYSEYGNKVKVIQFGIYLLFTRDIIARVLVCTATSWTCSGYTRQSWRHLRRHRHPLSNQVHLYQRQPGWGPDWGAAELEAVWSVVIVRPGNTTECRAATAAAVSSSVPCVVTCSTCVRLTVGASSTPLDVTSARPVASRSACGSAWTRTVSDFAICDSHLISFVFFLWLIVFVQILSLTPAYLAPH